MVFLLTLLGGIGVFYVWLPKLSTAIGLPAWALSVALLGLLVAGSIGFGWLLDRDR